VSAATDSQITAYLLTGVSITGGSISGTDSVLQALGKLQNQINGVLGGAMYQGTWNANTNSPALASGVGTNGYYYIVSVAGSTNLDGITSWNLGDWAIFAGTTWQKVDNTDAVISVNGNVGAVALTGTAGRVTISGANVFDIDAGYIGQSSITTLGTITTGTLGTTATLTALNMTLGSDASFDTYYRNGSGKLTRLANGTTGQFLGANTGGAPSWQTPAAGGVTGSGTTNVLTKWTSASAIGNSSSTDDGTRTTIGNFLKLGSGFEHSTIGQVNLTANERIGILEMLLCINQIQPRNEQFKVLSRQQAGTTQPKL
jgi:hypothetical protein